jgi:hypothetical protein
MDNGQWTMDTQLVHHGAAATSSTKVLTWLDSTASTPTLAYASHAIINVTRPIAVTVQPDRPEQHEEWIWNVQETLRTRLSYTSTSTSTSTSSSVITALTSVQPMGGSGICSATKTTTTTTATTTTTMLAAGMSNGSLTLWTRTRYNNNNNSIWEERVLMDTTQHKPAQQQEVSSITDIHSVLLQVPTERVLLATCSSAGALHHSYQNGILSSHVLTHHPTASVQWQALSETTLLLLVGTAAPRHNKIMVFSLTVDTDTSTSTSTSTTTTTTTTTTTNTNTNTNDAAAPHYCGALLGHEDWITCFAWQSLALPLSQRSVCLFHHSRCHL